MNVREGNTYAYKISAPRYNNGDEADRELIKKVIVTFGTKPQIRKEVEWNEKNQCYILELTQEDTKKMGGDNTIEFDVKFVFINGSVKSSDIKTFDTLRQINIDFE